MGISSLIIRYAPTDHSKNHRSAWVFRLCTGHALRLSGPIQKYANGDSATAFAEFEHRRKPNADAIAAMALENYVEMRDSVADTHFLLMRALERQLAARHPQRFVPRYWIVTFTRIPYSTAFERGKIQAQILRELTAGRISVDDVDMTHADQMVTSRLTPLPCSTSMHPF